MHYVPLSLHCRLFFQPGIFSQPGKRKIELPRVLTRGAMDTTKTGSSQINGAKGLAKAAIE
jgi:hypothetical protein